MLIVDLSCLGHDLPAWTGPGGPITFFDAEKAIKETGP
jgi:hypothetical protein